MTTEEDFHAALDANPDDWQTRLVFADWLDERGDPRGEGYRALGVLQLRPASAAYCWANARNRDSSPHHGFNLLPQDWYTLTTPNLETAGVYCFFDSRHEAEDAAARAFANLPSNRRAELLSAFPDV